MRYVLDAANMQTREMAHSYLALVFEFPEYYGNNLDALYDLLSERSNIEVEIINFNADTSAGYIQKIIRVMRDAGVNII